MPSPGPLSLDSSQVAQEQADPEPWCQQRLFSLEVREGGSGGRLCCGGSH